MPSQLVCSIGVIAYNEAQNIEKLLKALLNQKTDIVSILEIIVVSSASTDGTDEIVQRFASNNPKIRLIQESARNGKSSAINLFIQQAASEILIVESGDTIPAKDTIEKMVTPFADPLIGMTGGRPTPINNNDTFIGYSVQLLWRLHHRMALRSPKLGEMIAFRKVFDSIPPRSAVDEASIEAIIRDNSLKLQYVPNAIIYNKGPENMRDFVLQRRRIATGHFWLQQNQHYLVSSSKPNLLTEITIEELFDNPKQIIYLTGTMLLEIVCRVLGWYDFKVKKRNPYTWTIAQSTKNLTTRR